MINGTIQRDISRNVWPEYNNTLDERPTDFKTDGLLYLNTHLQLVFSKDDELGKKLLNIINDIAKEIYKNRLREIDLNGKNDEAAHS